MVLSNLTYIWHSFSLTIIFLLCALIGLTTFFIAIRLSCYKGFWHRLAKYFTTLVSIGFTSNFFILLYMPYEFISIVSTFIIPQASLLFLLCGMISCELMDLLNGNKAKSKRCKRDTSKI